MGPLALWALWGALALGGAMQQQQVQEMGPEPEVVRAESKAFLASPNRESRLQPRRPWAPTPDEFQIVASVVAHRQAQRTGSVPYLRPGLQQQVEHRYGFADTHVHQFSELGFGQRVIYGGQAPCDGEWHGIGQNIVRVLMVAPSMLEDDLMADLLPHCPATDLPTHDGWTHEQYGDTELKRAHEQGLSLIVQYAVNNPVLCAITRRFGDALNESCADKANIDRQVLATWRFDAANDWYRVALDPIDAAEAIAQGDLAVMIGVEASDYFAGPGRGGILGADGLQGRYQSDPSCDPRFDRAPDAGVLAEFGRWTEKECGLARAAVRHAEVRGVRSIFPTHEWNSPMGGAAVQHVDLFQPGYGIVMHSGAPQTLGIFRVGGAFASFAGDRDDFDKWPTPVEVARDPTLNTEYPRSQQGLTPMGRALVRAARDANIVVDLGHLSERGAFETLRLAQLWSTDPHETPPMLLSSHVTPRTTALGHTMDHEFYVGDALLDAMTAYSAQTGRMAVGYRTAGNPVRSVGTGVVPRRNCVTDALGKCWENPEGLRPIADGNGSSALQNYHLLQATRMPVAMGSDMNGGAGQVAPRTCMLQRVAKDGAVSWEEGTCPHLCKGDDCTGYARRGLATVAELPQLVAELACLYDGSEDPGSCPLAFRQGAADSKRPYIDQVCLPRTPTPAGQDAATFMEPLCRSAAWTVLAWGDARGGHLSHRPQRLVAELEEPVMTPKMQMQQSLDVVQRITGQQSVAGIQVTPAGDIVIPHRRSARVALRELRRKGLLGARCTPLKELVEGEADAAGEAE